MNTAFTGFARLAALWVSMVLLVYPGGYRAAKTASWHEITPQGGQIHAFATTSSGGLYTGTNEGFFRWNNNRWQAASDGLNSLMITSLVVDPADPQVVYAATEEAAGVYTTTDAGGHWSLSANGLSGWVRTLAIDPANGSIVYAQTGSQVFRSDDGGVSWQMKSQGIEPEGDLLSLRVAPTDPSVLYISEINGTLYRTADRGESWARTAPLLGERAGMIEIDPGNENIVYAGTFYDGIYVSPDGGQSWLKRNEGLPRNGNGQPINALLIDTHRPGSLYASMSGLGLYKTTDSGLHWSRISSVGQYTSPLVLAQDPQSANTLYAGYDGSGIFKSSNGGASWKDMNTGLSRLSARSLAADPKSANGLFVGLGAAGLWATTNGGVNWTSLNDGLEFADFPAIAVDPKNPRNLYLGADGGGFYRSEDGGTSWTHVDIGEDAVEVYALVVDPASPNILYAGVFDTGVYKSVDYGKSWSPTGLQGTSAIALAIDPVHTGTIYAAADGVWKSTDGGAHFSPMNDGLSEPCSNRLAVDPQTPERVYAVNCDSGLYASSNGGAHWDPVVVSGSGPSWISAFAMDPGHPQVLYAADGQHLYRSTDAGKTWDLFENGLPTPWEIDLLEVSPQSRGCVYAAGFYNPGLYTICP